MDALSVAERTRDRIVAAATQLLVEGGRDAVSTRAVCEVAAVQAPTLYRLFGDKQGLLDAVAAYGFGTYLSSGAALEAGPDPVEDLRRGWDSHVHFGLEHPYLYSLAYGDARPGTSTPAARAAAEILRSLVHRVAVAGRLRVAEDRAVETLTAAGCGVTLTLIALPADRRDLTLSTVVRESTIAMLATDAGSGPESPPAPEQPSPAPVQAAVQLRATLPQTTALSRHERGLLEDWLDRIVEAGG